MVIGHLMPIFECCLPRIDKIPKLSNILDERIGRRCDVVTCVDRVFVAFIHDCDFLVVSYSDAKKRCSGSERAIAATARRAAPTLLLMPDAWWMGPWGGKRSFAAAAAAAASLRTLLLKYVSSFWHSIVLPGKTIPPLLADVCSSPRYYLFFYFFHYKTLLYCCRHIRHCFSGWNCIHGIAYNVI